MKLTLLKALWTKIKSERIRYFFAVLFTAAAVASSIFFYTERRYLLFTLAIVCLMFFFNKKGWNSIKDNIVNYCVCCIIFALFHILTKILSVTEAGIVTYLWGYTAATLVCSLIYMFSPYLVYKIGLSKEKTSAHTYLSLLVILVCCTIFSSIYSIKENSKVKDVKFAKIPFVSVYKWSIETHNGETCYIITCPKGTFSVSPYKYPQIRDIHSKTQVKIMTTYQYKGLMQYDRLEIKN